MKILLYGIGIIVLCISCTSYTDTAIANEEHVFDNTQDMQEQDNHLEEELYTPAAVTESIEEFTNAYPAEEDVRSPVLQVGEANSDALQEPSKYIMQNSVVIYTYVDKKVYKVYTSPQRVTLIKLGPNEEIVGNIASGDTANWIITITNDRNSNIVYLKPIRFSVNTNLIINTTKRTYYLFLVSIPNTYMVSVEWRYPLDEMRQHTKKSILDMPVSLDKLYFGYDIIPLSKKITWVPIKIFDDSVRTYIQFSNKLALVEMPVLFSTDHDGKSSLINYRVIDEYYVLDRILYKGELRIGSKKKDVIKIVRLRQ